MAVEWSVVGWVVTAVLATAAIIATVIVTRRFGTRRAALTWFSESTPLISRVAEGSQLEVMYRDIPVLDPVLITVVFVNSGPRDITSDMFDAGRPISVGIAAQFYGVTKIEGGAKIDVPAVGTEPTSATIRVNPLLLKRRQSWSFSVVVSGVPAVTLDTPLIDTDVKEIVPRDWQGTIWSTFAEVFTGMGSPIAEVAALLVPGRRTNQG